jgi:hypothetical protein
MNEKDIKIYLTARKLVDTLNSAIGSELSVSKPELLINAKNIIQKYENEYAKYKIENDEELKDVDVLIKESEDLLSILPDASHDTLKELTEIIDKNAKELQDKLFYDPSLFYNKYLLNISSSNSDIVNKHITENERFKLWFTGSKCVDDNKQPRILYHGTSGLDLNEFDEFSFGLFPGAYFAEVKEYSEWFSRIKGGNSIMYRVYLRVLNPIDLTAFGVDLVTYDDFVTYIELRYGYKLPENLMLKTVSDREGGMWAWRYLRGGVDWLKLIAKNKEFDGFVYYENNPGDIDMNTGEERVTKAWLVFKANQIKSADIRNTTFSLQSNSIKMEKGGKAC